MKTTVFATLALAVFAGSATAQKMGGTNANAPSINQTIELEDADIEIGYFAITYASGRWAKALEDEGSRDQMRQMINSRADRAPLGSFETSADLEVGGVHVPEGEYRLAFKLDDKFQWQMVLTGDEGEIHIPLQLMDNPDPSKRLVISIYAGDEDGTAGLYLAFGGKFGMLSIVPKEGDHDEDDDHDGDGDGR